MCQKRIVACHRMSKMWNEFWNWWVCETDEFVKLFRTRNRLFNYLCVWAVFCRCSIEADTIISLSFTLCPGTSPHVMSLSCKQQMLRWDGLDTSLVCICSIGVIHVRLWYIMLRWGDIWIQGLLNVPLKSVVLHFSFKLWNIVCLQTGVSLILSTLNLPTKC